MTNSPKTTEDLKNLADFINKNYQNINAKYWNKKGERIYLQGVGYNTNKVETSSYIELVDGKFIQKSFVKCDVQPFEWCMSQSEENRQFMYQMILKFENEAEAQEAGVYFYIKNDGNVVNDACQDCEIADLFDDGGGLFASENAAKNFAESHKNTFDFQNYTIESIEIDTYNELRKEAIAIAMAKAEEARKNAPVRPTLINKKKSSKNRY